jgi:cholesterol oxidase
MATNGFDYDVIVMAAPASGECGGVRATEKGYRVGVMESGKRWRRGYSQDELGYTQVRLAAESGNVRHPAHGVSGRCPGSVRRRGGRWIHVYGNTSTSRRKVFDATGITDWADVAPTLIRLRGCSGGGSLTWTLRLIV